MNDVIPISQPNANAIGSINHAETGLSILFSKPPLSPPPREVRRHSPHPAAITVRLHCMPVSTNEISSFLILDFSFVKLGNDLTAAVLPFGRAAFDGPIIGCASRLLFRTLNGCFAGQ